MLALGAASRSPAQEPTLSQQLEGGLEGAVCAGSPRRGTDAVRSGARARARRAAGGPGERGPARDRGCTRRQGDYASARARLDEALPIAASRSGPGGDGPRPERNGIRRVVSGSGSRHAPTGSAPWPSSRPPSAVKDAANTVANIVLLLPDQEIDPWLERGLALAEQARGTDTCEDASSRRGETCCATARTSRGRGRRFSSAAAVRSGKAQDAQITCLNSLGLLHRVHGRADQAARVPGRALALAREVGESLRHPAEPRRRGDGPWAQAESAR